MGFDLYGNNPKSERGEYFRASSQYWSRLWDFCTTYSPDAAALGSAGYSNDRAQMTAEAAERLAQAIRAKVADGTAQKFAAGYIAAPDPMQKWLEENFGAVVLYDAEADFVLAKPGTTRADLDKLLGITSSPTPYQDKLQQLADFAAESGGFTIE